MRSQQPWELELLSTWHRNRRVGDQYLRVTEWFGLGDALKLNQFQTPSTRRGCSKPIPESESLTIFLPKTQTTQQKHKSTAQQRPNKTNICFSTALLPDPHMMQLHTKPATALAPGTLQTNGSSPGWVIIFGLCNPNTLLLDQEQTQARN